MIDDIFLLLGLDKSEWLEDIERKGSSLPMSCVEECIGERECTKSEEGLNIKAMYKTFKFKKYLHGVSDAGSTIIDSYLSQEHMVLMS